jgi:hypothetical protein
MIPKPAVVNDTALAIIQHAIAEQSTSAGFDRKNVRLTVGGS